MRKYTKTNKNNEKMRKEAIEQADPENMVENEYK